MKKSVVIGAVTLAALGIVSYLSSKMVVAQNAARDILPLQLEEQIPVPSVAGRIDHFSADAKRKRLFVSALGNNSLEVIDVFAGRVIHSIKGLAQPQGPLYVPAVDKLYVANAEDGKVRVYDGATYTLRKTIDFGKDPDNMRYDEASKRVYVGFGEDDGGIGMIDPKTMFIRPKGIRNLSKWRPRANIFLRTSRMRAMLLSPSTKKPEPLRSGH